MTPMRRTITATTLLAATMAGLTAQGQSSTAPAVGEEPVAVSVESRPSQGRPTPAKTELPREITIEREVFSYSSGGRRDPYKSLMSSSDIRPLLSDLRLTAVAFDPAGSNSVAILRDSYTKQQYRIRVGQQLGRLRVTAIRQKAVQFSMEEFGFNRQETLLLTSSDTTKVRNP